MAFLREKKFSFISTAPSLTPETFAVVKFKGFEAISKPYEFDIMLVSNNPEIDLSEVLQKPARFMIHRENGGEVHYNGILAQFEQLHEFGGYVFYRALLVPKLWWLTLTHHNQVCLGDSVINIIQKTLLDGGLMTFDFEFKIQKEYQLIDYVCQYRESHFNFISRWVEREGIYYYFEQTDNGEKIIFTDTTISHADLPKGESLYYSPPSGMDTLHRTETIKTLTCRQQMLPVKVFLKDYNYERPSLEITGSADVDPNGRGEVYIYGEHFPTTEEGNRLAAIRAEELLCRKIQFFGESTIPFMIPGYTFTMQDHYRASYNQKYLIEEVTHEGNQTGYLISGIRTGISEMEEKVYYRNTFTAIPADVQFRPERKAEKPRISGTLHAVVDAEGSGDYAELDEQGRYKVRLPFDINDEHIAGKASSFVRMIQPYAGNNYGVHFPLHKGTEVLLSFVNGDPDRPVISGAIPNPETVSPVTAANQTKSIFRDNYGNELIFDSTPGDEHIRLHSPHHNSTLELGRSLKAATADEEAVYVGGNSVEGCIGNKLEGFLGNAIELKAGLSAEAFFGGKLEAEVAGKLGLLFGPDCSFHWGPKYEYHWGDNVERTQDDINSIADKNYIISAGKTINIVGGTTAKELELPGGDKEDEKSSIIEANENKLILSFGKNRNPVHKKKISKEDEIRAENLWASGLALGIGSAVAAALSFIFFAIYDINSKDDCKIIGQSIGHTLTVGEGIMVTLAIIFWTISKGLRGVDDNIQPVSHCDEKGDVADALIELQKEGIFLGIKPKVTGVPPALDKDKSLSQVQMDNMGKVTINSNAEKTEDQQILLGIGKSGEETAKITMKDKEFTLECGKSKIWISPKTGNIYISIKNKASNTLKLSSSGFILNDAKKKITLNAPEVIIKNKFKSKNLFDLG